jgi:uncharacterized radical SAM superfamily Fe-S cluster-containing enzyme
MNIRANHVIRNTGSLCPVCLKGIPAVIYERDNGEVYMWKRCPDHGEFDVYIWPDASRYQWFYDFQFLGESRLPQTSTHKGCPGDCGLCPNHKRAVTLPEIEVTYRCNLSCPVCFMNDGEVPGDPSMDVIRYKLEIIRRFDGQNLPIQITGGEPTVRKDLPEIIALCRSMGFDAVELNTNGMVIGNDPGYLRSLKDAGLTNVYLQFDGTFPEATRLLRGGNYLPRKMAAIENCRKENIPVILSVTVVRGTNEWNLGGLVEYAMNNLDAIKGLALQAAFESGRFDLMNMKHLSVGDIAMLVSEQTSGKIGFNDFWPVASSHPLCYGSTYLMGSGDDYVPITRDLDEREYARLFNTTSPQGAFFMDMVANLKGTAFPPEGLPILIMEYMDAWTMDLERVRNCNLAVTLSDGRSVPFCMYHLTDSKGRRKFLHGGGER